VAGGTASLAGDTVESNSAGGNDSLGVGGGIDVGGSSATLCNDTIESNSALFESNGRNGTAGGIYIATGATVYIDSFTVAHTINNTDMSGTNGSTANIDGTYILQDC
jgi:hypothetical protein